MKPPLTILWRGSLTSCNYACPYCPFAKTHDDRAALARDRAALERFVGWALAAERPLEVLFTPWGEALIRKAYQDALARLSNAPHVRTVAIQTNLSCNLGWIAACNPRKAAFWATYHPGETRLEAFLGKIAALERKGARYSVGVVGLRQHFAEIEALRAALPPSAYLWVNAYKDEPDYYGAEEVDRLRRIDPLFDLNLADWPSRGRACAGGETTIAVDAAGDARRCHFLADPIGNIYDPAFESALRPRACPADTCGCHIGYAHLKDLDLRGLFGEGFLERRPSRGAHGALADAHRRRFEAAAS